ncbi:redoxin domain-containing protein, partial [Klebsiella pneumoniae]
MASKIRRWLRELAVWLLIGAAVSLAVDYFRQPALPQNVSATSLQTLDGRTLDLNAMSQQKPLLLYVWATWCGVCRYTTPSVASLAADGGNVLTVALRSGDNVKLERWLTRKKMTLPTVNDPSGQ